MTMLHYLLLFLCVCFVNSAPGDRITVNISDGALSGIEGVTSNRSYPFWAFLGIPYAAPPVGNLRFRPPQPVKPWSGVRDASYERSICMQPNANGTSEDCLFISVYTTIPPGTNVSALPVMVNIHGGGFYLGSGNLGLHGADLLIENGVVVVTLNYRLGAFGFLCTLDSASPGNYGLKDQIAALKWVQNNIAQFGGDPKRVTIFGHSAGSASIMYLLQSEQTRGLYHAAIPQSGSTMNPWAVAQEPRALAFRVGLTNLIVTLNSNDLVNRLRKVGANQLLQTTSGLTFDLRDSQNGLAWSPCLENSRPDAVVTTYSYQLLSYGSFNRVPVMTGFASLEARDTNRLPWLSTLYSVQFALFPATLVPKDMHAVDNDAAGAEIKKFYFNDQPIGNNTNFVRYASDNLFVRGINKHVALMSKYVPVYYYRFAFIGGSQHNKLDPEGASHGEELQFLFNVNQTTPEAKRTQTRVVKLWTNFAKYYDPTPQVDSDLTLVDVSWSSNANNSSGNSSLVYLNIDTNFSVGQDPEKEQMQFWDGLYTKYGFQPYNSY